ncbi:MAG: hypothetical protein JW996_07085, partial [Candidatus Cloacimonetes bacterium]|nr:hypothetical protein [Candidatus Cloacimonadota bacterium]
MKIILALLVILPVALSAVTIIDLSVSNEIPEFRKDNEYLYPVKSTDHNFDGIAGSPVIPVRTVFFQIPDDFKVKGVLVDPGDQIEVFLSNPLYPQQKNQPLSIPAREVFTQPEEEYYSDSFYPSELIFSTGSGMTGSAGIGYVSFYCGQYNAENSILKIPSELKLKVELEQHQQAILPDNRISELILGNLGLTDREIFPEGSGNYLLITGEEFLEEYQDLLNWRFCQGWNVFSATVEEIEQTVSGTDLQEKIRNFILDYVQQESITHVTLAGDTDLLPDRKFFAFDCEYGSYQDENEIPSDMYYSCLNGDWDANGNGIYGEEEDEPDYFPDVVVSRISTASGMEVQDYVQRLIAYESGSLTDYPKAGGLSMELWEGSNSEICQQYIYANYFPEEYQINLVYGEDNTTENAYQLLNQNMNIVQHTGHAGRYSIALENGHINNQNIDQLENDWGGMFYSIGCWSAALDYDSIGENLVVTPGKGQLAYIGNSRYGWGAPSAPGFGFSEFYQKTFFKNMFWHGINSPANGNALQKIPYIPFFQGTSVYKWVAYELNAVTDSGFRLSNQEPLNVDYQSCFTPEGLLLQFSVEGFPLKDLLLTAGDHQYNTDINGTIQLDYEQLGENIVTYKYGYKSLFLDIADLVSEPAIVVISGISDTGYHQGEDLEIVT